MSLGWLRRWFGFLRHDDAYARSRSKLNRSIITSIHRQQELGRTIWLVIHSPEIYVATQELLDSEGLSYEVVRDEIDVREPNMAQTMWPLIDSRAIQLILAPLIPETTPSPEKAISNRTVAMLVLDRSSDIGNDDRLERFCKNLPVPFELGYFQALEDPLVSRVLDDTAMIVLEQLGLDQHDLITSNMITSRLNRLLRREAKQKSRDNTGSA